MTEGCDAVVLGLTHPWCVGSCRSVVWRVMSSDEVEFEFADVRRRIAEFGDRTTLITVTDALDQSGLPIITSVDLMITRT